MASIGSLYASLTLDAKGFQRGVKTARSSMRNMRNSISRTQSKIAALTAALGVGFSVKGIIQTADAYAGVENRLRLVTKSSKELAEVQGKLFDVAQRSRNEFTGVADLYARLARVSGSLNLSQTELLTITESINKAITISGVSSESANAALVQLGQGFAAGALRGEELNSVMEQTPRLAQAIADGMGVSIGQLRELGKAGLLTAEAVSKALLSQSDVIEAEFATTNKTIGQSFTQLANVVNRAISQVSTSDLTDSVDQLRMTLSDPSILKNLQSIAAAFLDIVNIAAQAASKVVEFGKGIGIVAAQILNPDLQDKANRFEADITRLKQLIANNPTNRIYPIQLQIAEEALAKVKKQIEDIASYVPPKTKQTPTRKPTSPLDLSGLTAGTKADKNNNPFSFDTFKIDPRITSINDALGDSLDKYNDKMEAGKRIYEETRTPLERLNIRITELNRLQEEGVISWDTYARAVFQAQDELDKFGEETEDKTEKIKSLSEELGLSFASAFEDAIVQGGNLRDVLKGLEQDILRIVTRQLVTKPLADSIGGLLGGKGGGLLGGIFGSIFGGGKAGGGPVMGGRAYLVGEEGPEMFVPPGGGGNIIPNGKMGGTNVTINISGIQDATGVRKAAGQVAAAAALAVDRGRRNL